MITSIHRIELPWTIHSSFLADCSRKKGRKHDWFGVLLSFSPSSFLFLNILLRFLPLHRRRSLLFSLSLLRRLFLSLIFSSLSYYYCCCWWGMKKVLKKKRSFLSMIDDLRKKEHTTLDRAKNEWVNSPLFGNDLGFQLRRNDFFSSNISHIAAELRYINMRAVI